MKFNIKRLSALVSVIITLSMIITAFVACKSNAPTDNTGNDITQSSSPNDASTEAGSEKDTENIADTDEIEPNLTVDEAPLIEYASSVSNGIKFGFSNPSRTALTFENQEMSLEYALSIDQDQLVKKLVNKNGNAYIENTMDVFVKMKNGNKYYSSDSYVSTSANAFRFGYYFYEVRLQDQIFTNDMEIAGARKINHIQWEIYHQCMPVIESGVLKVTNDDNATDAYISFNRRLEYDTEKYQLLKVTMKADSKASLGELFIIAGGNTSYTPSSSLTFQITNDGKYHEYLLPISNIAGYTGKLTGLRLDVLGQGCSYEISGIELIETNTKGAPTGLVLSRSFLTYSDKMHHVIQVAAKQKTENIECIGMETRIPNDKVAKLIVKDANGTHDTLDSIDWNSAEYVGFDIVDAGIFGYILPYDGKGGSIEVTLSDGVYTVTQTMTPKDNIIEPSVTGTLNANDFYMGQRIYTDYGHDFTEFIEEAYCERNPLTDKYIKINSGAAGAAFSGYDSLRGIYVFTMARISGGFNTPYYQTPNKHYNIDFTIRGDEHNRRFYAMTATDSGQLECAVLLDANDLLLPIPIEVGKNFSEEAGDRSIFNLDDAPYSEAIFPLIVKENEKVSYNIINLYQRWGNFPLKQLSWIQFQSPYYHLSTGVVETNCILPWSYTPWSYTNNFKGLNTLPDFRPMSAPFWASQPQHTSCGTHTWLVYTDENGGNITYECTDNRITSYGPIYAEVEMDYISDDGKIRSTYTHMELPQTDENRTYYSMSYEVLEDISFSDFSNQFEFYKVTDNDPTGIYQQLGYLNENNECTVTDAAIDNRTETEDGKVNTEYAPSVKYLLGDNCPYFSLFNMKEGTKDNGYSNVALLIYNSEFIICGTKVTPQFAITHTQNTVRLTLNYSELTLKAGDKFTISCILLPWGSQETVYDGSNGLAPDQSVRNVREDTLLDPIKATPYSDTDDCTVIESTFIPKLRTSNGKNATFTVSGGSRVNAPAMADGRNNIAVRLYGFDMLTAPTVEELVDGEWVPYELNSFNNPDAGGYVHSYDGYAVYYDGDGTFSYAFVIDMTDGKDRTFRISADKDFDKWPPEPDIDNGRTNYFDAYADPIEIADTFVSSNPKFYSSYTVADDESFIRVFGTGGKGEGYFYAFENNDNESGGLIVLKYRIPTTNNKVITQFQFYTSTVVDRANGDCLVSCSNAYIEPDGEWHVLVIDATKVVEGSNGTAKEGFLSNIFVPAEDEKYYATHLRFDFFSDQMADDNYIDIAFIGMDNSLEDINMHLRDGDVTKYTLIEGLKHFTVDSTSGEITDNSPPEIESYIHPDSEYKLSNLKYVSNLDTVNGIRPPRRTANFQTTEIVTINYNGKTVKSGNEANNLMFEGTHLIASGWAVVEGGVSKYVWSADGGKTWNDAEACGRSLGTASQAMIDKAHELTSNAFTFTTNDVALGSFQGTGANMAKGICANLKDYIGQTVHIIFAIVPATDTSSLCPIAYVTGVKVVAEEEIKLDPIYNEYVKEGSGYSVSYNNYASCIDYICGTQYTGTTRYSDTGNNGVTTMVFNKTTTVKGNNSQAGTFLNLGGWAVIQSGMEKLLYSIDGGATWIIASMEEITDVNSNLINNGANKRGTPYTFTVENDSKGGNFQGDKLYIDLSAHAGNTFDLILAAAPVSSPNTLCILANITGITVPAN